MDNKSTNVDCSLQIMFWVLALFNGRASDKVGLPPATNFVSENISSSAFIYSQVS